jgi:hypothetical protein
MEPPIPVKPTTDGSVGLAGVKLMHIAVHGAK